MRQRKGPRGLGPANCSCDLAAVAEPAPARSGLFGRKLVATRNIAASRQLFLAGLFEPARSQKRSCPTVTAMNDIIYIIGLIVVVMFILSVLGLR
jgi:hypothetical protein